MTKIKVAHLLQVVGPAGKEQGVLKIVSQMNSAKFEVDIVAMRGVRYPELLGLERFNMVVPDEVKGNSLKLIPRLRRIFREKKYDIVYTHSWNTLLEGFIAGRLAGVPILVHGEHGTFERSAIKDRIQPLFWRQFDAVTVVVGDLERKLRKIFGYRKNNISVIYNGTDSGKFHPSREFRQQFREANDLRDAFLVGTVGRFHGVKDHFTLIRGFARFRKTGVPAKLLLVGGGGKTGETFKTRYEQLIGELDIGDDVIFVPPTAEPEKVLNAFDVFVLSSISEGCSNVILEAMSCGIPVVATRTGGNPELVREDENGLLFAVGDDEQLAAHLQTLSADAGLRERFSGNSLRIIENEFTLSGTIADYENLFIKLYNENLKNGRK